MPIMERRKRTRRAWTPEFKAEAVKLVLAGRRSIAAVARELDVNRGSLREWVLTAQMEAAGKDQSAVPKPTSSKTSAFERDELARLRKENAKLRMERDFLKKAAAFFAKENS